MSTKIPMMVIGQTPRGKKSVKVVELCVSADEYSKGDHYQEALRLAFEEGLMGPMMALAPEDAMLMVDGIATLKQCLLGTDAVVNINSRAKTSAQEKMSKIA